MTQHAPPDPRSVAVGTGRIAQAIRPKVRQILFSGTAADAAKRHRQYAQFAQFDRAQIVMLHSAGLLAGPEAARLLRAIEDLAGDGMETLAVEEAPRGAYMLWEQALARATGPDLVGAAHLGRSRNDLNATACRVQGRTPCFRLILEALRLVQAILHRAREWQGLVTVAYTNYQPAMPITLAHQAVAWAAAVERDVRHLLFTSADLDACPLGAGAVAGTSLPINPATTARLLGFARTTPNSIDAVASRDFVLQLQADAAVLAVTLSRIATDVLAMVAGSTPLMELPDEVVGASSAMPQKRNPFVLEHVQSRGGTALGAFVASAHAMQATPYTNGVAVGTEAVRGAYTSLADVAEAATLLRYVVEVMTPDAEQMRKRAATSYVNATSLVERLCARGGMSFRAAHELVGRAVSEAIAARGVAPTDFTTAALRLMREAGMDPSVIGSDWTDPATLAGRAEQGGGPGDRSVASQIAGLRGAIREHCRSVRCRRLQYRYADRQLARSVEAILHELVPGNAAATAEDPAVAPTASQSRLSVRSPLPPEEN